MNQQKELRAAVEQWQAEGKWQDRGRFRITPRGVKEYVPTKSEIAAKCKLLRSVEKWRGAHKRAPRGGKHAVKPLTV